MDQKLTIIIAIIIVLFSIYGYRSYSMDKKQKQETVIGLLENFTDEYNDILLNSNNPVNDLKVMIEVAEKEIQRDTKERKLFSAFIIQYVLLASIDLLSLEKLPLLGKFVNYLASMNANLNLQRSDVIILKKVRRYYERSPTRISKKSRRVDFKYSRIHFNGWNFTFGGNHI